jgi:2-keto-4-pentenoate hydratase
VLGTPRSAVSWPPPALPTVALNGQPKATAEVGRVVSDPAGTLKAAGTYLASVGESLEPGDWVITGSMIVPFGVAAGDSVRAEFGELSIIELRFV